MTTYIFTSGKSFSQYKNKSTFLQHDFYGDAWFSSISGACDNAYYRQIFRAKLMKKNQSPLTVKSQQQAMRWFTLSHALGLAVFFALMAGFFWYLHGLEQEQNRQLLFRDVEWSQQTIKLRLSESKEQVSQAASEWSSYSASEVMSAESQRGSALRKYFASYPEVMYVAIADKNRRILWFLPSRNEAISIARSAGTAIEDSAGFAAFNEARSSKKVVFSEPINADARDMLIEMHSMAGKAAGQSGDESIVVGISLTRLITNAISSEVRSRYEFSLTDQGGNRLLGTSPRTLFLGNFNYELPLDPPGHGIRLRATLFETGGQLLTSKLVFVIAGLSCAIVLSMLLLWRHTRRRMAAENERDRLFMLSLDLLCVMSRDGTLVKVNPSFADNFPTVLNSATASATLTDFAHPEDRQKIAAAFLSTTPSASFEARFLRSSSSPVQWLAWSMRLDSTSNPACWYSVAHDVTSRKVAEQALAAEIGFRKAMEDSMVTGMRAFDLQGKVTYVNRAFCSMVGWTNAELIGKTAPFPYWPQEDYQQHADNLLLILAGKAPASGLEVRVERSNRSHFYARMYVSPLIDAGGVQTGWMTSMTDITEPMKIRKALSDAQERFITVLDELESSVSVLSASGDLLFTNQAYQQLFGNSSDGHERLAINPTIGEQFDSQTKRWFDVRSRSIRWVDDSQVTMIMATDTTRRHEAEDAQRLQGEKLQQSSRLVTMGEMASSLAHELNQPLSAIANYCMGLAARIRSRTASGQSIDTDETLDALKKASGQAERAGKVIRRIREFVKRSEPERKRCTAQTLVNNAVTLADIEARRFNIPIQVKLAPDLPALMADPILIEQVLINLIKNGLEAMRDAPAKLADTPTYLLVSVHVDGNNTRFEVRDYGSGVPLEIEGKLFEPFFTTKAEGMGMGLNICRSIIEAHGGQLTVQRHIIGSSFVFTLPLEANKFSDKMDSSNQEKESASA